MGGCIKGEGTPVNSFALVAYLPDLLGEFLDHLRTELVLECHAKAHLTLLPPRPLLSTPDEAWHELKGAMHDFQPFRVQLGDIELFPQTQVIYLAVRSGRTELDRLHQALNTGKLYFAEPYPYHPHVTLAQELQADQVAPAVEVANRRWREYRGPHDFLIDQLTFVQNTMENRWTDLAGCPLDHSNISI